MLRNLYIKSIVIVIILSTTSCDTVDNSENRDSISSTSSKSDDWLIPTNEVFDGGPGKDGIPALTNPDHIKVNSTTYVGDNDLVLVYSHNNGIRIYPHPILDWHEIINDRIGDQVYSITYCPLTGSGINWNRKIDGEETTFGVSGLLYNTNLLPYDRKTESNWSQMRLQSVNGELITTFAETFPLLETSWKTAKELFPDASVVSINTGYSRNYGSYPYGDYRTNHSSLIFPVNRDDSRLNRKERVLGVIADGLTKAYSILDFPGSTVFIDSIGTEKFLIYGNNDKNLIVAFELSGLYSDLTFSKSTLPLPYIFDDNFGNRYDIFGQSKDANKIDLVPAKSFIAYWFAWAAFYPSTELYQN